MSVRKVSVTDSKIKKKLHLKRQKKLRDVGHSYRVDCFLWQTVVEVPVVLVSVS